MEHNPQIFLRLFNNALLFYSTPQQLNNKSSKKYKVS